MGGLIGEVEGCYVSRIERSEGRILATLISNRSFQSGISENAALWIVIGAVSAIDAVWLMLSGIKINFGITLPVVFLFLLVTNLFYTYIRPNSGIATLTTTLAQLLAFTSANLVLIYLTVTSNLPLADQNFDAADAALGLHWPFLFNWVKDRPVVVLIFEVAYYSITPQAVAVPLILVSIGRVDRAREFVWLFAITLLIITPIAWLLPAESAWVYYNVTDRIHAYHMDIFTALRSGNAKEIVMETAEGVVTFPSFHAALGLILIYVSRGIGILFPCLAILNLLMIASTPTEGGHYFIDVIAGLAMVPIAILILRSKTR